MHPMLNIAVRAARAAGNVITRAYEQLDLVTAEQKGSNDVVTNVDIEAEQAILAMIQKSYPNHCFVGEEVGVIEGSETDYQWVIDPLNGTTNFIKGIPHFSVSIALKIKGKLDQAVIYDPIRGELFTASKGAGAQLNGYRIRTSKAKELKGTIIGTGFPHRQKHQTETYLNMFQAMFIHAADVRSSGCPSLDLAYVAAGRIDGFFEMGLKPWEISAGQLIMQEAGILATDFAGGNKFELNGNIVAGNARVVKEMIKEMRPHLTDSLAN